MDATGEIDPHAADPDEDPLDHLGPVIEDPWDDPRQQDWSDWIVRGID